jgi:hypothetical protein
MVHMHMSPEKVAAEGEDEKDKVDSRDKGKTA